MPRPIAILPALGVLALALVACGGGAAASPATSAAAPTAAPAVVEPTGPAGGVAGDLTPGTNFNACEIVTPAEIKHATQNEQAVTDGIFRATPDTLSPGKTECRYEGEFGRIIVTLVPEDGANLYDAARGAYKDASDITGIGDGAFNSDQNRRAFIWKERVNVMLTMSLNGDLEQLPIATELGQAIVAKL
jgi:hypothetical protein